ncbi:MAG: FixH family protein, partial [Vibrio sp.]
PWFLIALPLAVVAASFTTLYLFNKNSVSLVSEDYYKEGKAINVDLSKVRIAKELGLSATARSTQAGIEIKLTKGKLETFPALDVAFAHRTLADKDFATTVTSDANGVYRIRLDTPIQGPWHVKIMPHNQAWLIQGKVGFPSQQSIEIME